MIIWVACWKGRRERREALFVIKESFQKSFPDKIDKSGFLLYLKSTFIKLMRLDD